MGNANIQGQIGGNLKGLICPKCKQHLIKVEGKCDCEFTCGNPVCRGSKTKYPTYYGYTQGDINANITDVIIAIVGSRRRKDEENVREVVRKLYFKYKSRLVIVSGGCVGVDSWAEDEARKLNIRVKIFKPDLEGVYHSRYTYYDIVRKYYARNKLIAEFAVGGIIAFVAEDRKGGTENTIKHAKKLDRIVILK